mgnify:CR=1 FL=1
MVLPCPPLEQQAIVPETLGPMDSPSASNSPQPETADDHYLISDYVVQDLRRTLLKVAANEGWYEQTWLGVPVWQLPEDLQLLQVELDPAEAGDIAVQHRLRECLTRHRPGQEEAGVRVPVIARVAAAGDCRWVRLGSQFCVADAPAALQTLTSARFRASLRSPLGAA